MSYRCDICGKGRVIGRSQTHRRGVAGKRWRKRAQSTLKVFKPNLQWVSLYEEGKKIRMRLCTSCLKRERKLRKKEVVIPTNLQMGN